MDRNLTLILSLQQVLISAVAAVAADVSSLLSANPRYLVDNNLTVVVISYLLELILITASAAAGAFREVLYSIAADQKIFDCYRS